MKGEAKLFAKKCWIILPQRTNNLWCHRILSFFFFNDFCVVCPFSRIHYFLEVIIIYDPQIKKTCTYNNKSRLTVTSCFHPDDKGIWLVTEPWDQMKIRVSCGRLARWMSEDFRIKIFSDPPAAEAQFHNVHRLMDVKVTQNSFACSVPKIS